MIPSMNALNTASAPAPAAIARRNGRRALIGLAAIGIGGLALADNLLGQGDHALLRSFWPLALVGVGLAKLLAAQHLGSRIGGGVLVAIGTVILGTKLGIVEPQALRAWWPLAPILAGSALIARSWMARSRA